MSDLAAFLLARIAEDERVARRAEESPGSYRGHPSGTAPLWTVSAASARGREIGPRGSVEATPGRVLADCAAKRVIVAEHAIQDVPVLELWGEVTMSGPECRVCADWDAADMDGPPRAAGPCRTLRLLASPFADHPDFDPAWTVTA